MLAVVVDGVDIAVTCDFIYDDVMNAVLMLLLLLSCMSMLLPMVFVDPVIAHVVVNVGVVVVVVGRWWWCCFRRLWL